MAADAEDVLKVLYLPPSPPSIVYRPWTRTEHGPSLLAWYLSRLRLRYGSDSLLVACHSEVDRTSAEQEATSLGVFVIISQAETLTGVLGEVALAFPGMPIAWFRLESMFTPTDLLDRVSSHHRQYKNHLTWVADLPEDIVPEIAEPAYLAAIAAIAYDDYVPSPREAATKLERIRAAPFRAQPFYSIPHMPEIPCLRTAADAERVQQAIQNLPLNHSFEMVERWASTTFEPVVPQPGLAKAAPENRVLYLSPGSLYSGAEECLRGLVQGLAGSSFRQYALVGMEGTLSDRLRTAGCQVTVTNWPFHGEGQTSIDFAARVIDSVSPSLIHCNADPGPGFLGRAHAARIPLVGHVRTAAFTNVDPYLRLADHVIAVSHYTSRRLVEEGIPQNRIAVIYEGVDVERFFPNVFDKDAMRRRFELPQNAFIILMVARPAALKRHDLMLSAFASMKPADGHLVLVGNYGEPDVLSRIRRTLVEKDLRQRVTWLPFQDDIREIECAADVLALPSDYEALGMCVLEAMALEIPVVVSDSGGSLEVIENGVSGLAMRGGDAASLESALHELRRSAGLRRQLGQNARKHVEQLFTLDAHVKQVAAYFRAILV